MAEVEINIIEYNSLRNRIEELEKMLKEENNIFGIFLIKNNEK